jgi:predicted MPP superfamily phosphohydrolase
MRGLWVIIVLLFIEIYAFKGLRSMTIGMDPLWRKVISVVFWLTTVITYGGFLYFVQRARTGGSADMKIYGLMNIVVATALLFISLKLLFGTFHLLNDVVNGIKFLWTKVSAPPVSEVHEGMSRVQFFNQLGLGVAAAWAGTMLYGITRGKFNYRVMEETLAFPHLPASFDGLRIVQISDMHLGSFNRDFDSVQKGFDKISALEADYVFFTGDLVNNFSDEAEPWVDRLKGIKARHGKFAILGNHDYGDYAMSDNPEAKARSLNRIVEIFHEAGFRLLRNENVTLERNGERIALLGSENWGVGFHQYGDLEKTMQGVNPNDFMILLSHDPTHWQEQVIGKVPAALTLAGHTHGAQMGLELPQFGIKLSAARIRYKRWGGLYREGNQYLYINRGFGYIGFPGRIGMSPEITLLELKKA